LQVMIKFKDGVDFERLCMDYLGQRAEFVQDFMMATAPGTGDRMCIYRIPDESTLSTWIRIKHPDWIDYSWTNKNKSAQVLDPDETFLQLQARDAE